MRRAAGLLLIAASGFLALGAGPADHPADKVGTADKATAAVEAERRAKEAYFRDNPWSPLRAIVRYDFPSGAAAHDAIAGSAEGADLRLDATGVAPRQLSIGLLPPAKEGEPWRFRLQRLAPGGEIQVGGKPMAASQMVEEETLIQVGPFALRPYVQAGTGILVLFDSRRTAGERFVPPAAFPIDPAWRFQARLIPYPQPETLRLQTSLGRVKEYRRAGYFELAVPGAPKLRVNAYQPTFVRQPEEELSILFTDQTSGNETYGAGRYLDLAAPVDGLYTIDFNRAYNPLCAYTGVYNCPIPPRENAFPVKVPAGEKVYPGHATKSK
jgi:hypothetical protein